MSENQSFLFMSNSRIKPIKDMSKNNESLDLSEVFEKKCQLLLQESKIRFAGIIDGMGSLVAGGFKEGIEPIKDESTRKRMFLEAAIRVRTRKDFDPDLGPVRYAASRRDKVVMMTFPISDNHIVFVSTEPDVDIEKLAVKILSMIGKI